MNTPSHYIINLALLGTTLNQRANIAITIGAILPDLPIFTFYGVAKWIYHLSETEIWTEAYYQPFWQNLIALFHSFPLGLIALIICGFKGWQMGMILAASFLLHSVFDFPFHHDDAHRHFFPFSNYRLISPLSYWDPRHYGNWVALGELLLVIICTPIVWNLLQSYWTKGIVLIINCFYIFAYYKFYFLRLF